MKDSIKFKKKSRHTLAGGSGPLTYYYENDVNEDSESGIRRSLYSDAESCEWNRAFELPSLSPENQLDRLKGEIAVRIKITKNEIFKIGELLISAKKICQQEGIKFQEWISNNLDFSYETANNFMNVYKQCLGVRSIAMNLSPSILYQISAPSFPDELRKYLFDSEQLNEITNGRLKEITRKYKEGGFEAIQDDIEELNRGLLIQKQSLHTLDMVENALRTLEALKEKIEKRGQSQRLFIPFENLIKTDEPEAFEVNSKLISALKSAIDLLDKARKESVDILANFESKLFEKVMVESDGQIEKGEKAEVNAQLKKIKKSKM